MLQSGGISAYHMKTTVIANEFEDEQSVL